MTVYPRGKFATVEQLQQCLLLKSGKMVSAVYKQEALPSGEIV